MVGMGVGRQLFQSFLMHKMKTEAYKKRLIEFFGMEWERYW
jgi:hypothetical protein